VPSLSQGMLQSVRSAALRAPKEEIVYGQLPLGQLKYWSLWGVERGSLKEMTWRRLRATAETAVLV